MRAAASRRQLRGRRVVARSHGGDALVECAERQFRLFERVQRFLQLDPLLRQLRGRDVMFACEILECRHPPLDLILARRVGVQPFEIGAEQGGRFAQADEALLDRLQRVREARIEGRRAAQLRRRARRERMGVGAVCIPGERERRLRRFREPPAIGEPPRSAISSPASPSASSSASSSRTW